MEWEGPRLNVRSEGDARAQRQGQVAEDCIGHLGRRRAEWRMGDGMEQSRKRGRLEGGQRPKVGDLCQTHVSHAWHSCSALHQATRENRSLVMSLSTSPSVVNH